MDHLQLVLPQSTLHLTIYAVDFLQEALDTHFELHSLAAFNQEVAQERLGSTLIDSPLCSCLQSYCIPDHIPVPKLLCRSLLSQTACAISEKAMGDNK